MSGATLMRAILDEARKSADGAELGGKLKGLNKDQFLTVVEKVTQALDTLPETYSMHVVVHGVAFVRNALIVAMQYNEDLLRTPGSEHGRA